MENEVANIALYLNCALKLIRNKNNKLHYLTGNELGAAISRPGTQNQETQCLVVGGALWIANNDDADTNTQRELLNRLGINRFNKLAEHVEKYRGRVLPTHNGAYNQGAFTLKHKLLFALIPESKRLNPPAAYTSPMPTSVNNVTYNVGNQVNNLKNNSRIVFVTGTYEGQGGGQSGCHAEQKLLAALGLLWKDPFSHKQPVYLQGCKSPCTRCEQVLNVVSQRIRTSSGKRFSSANITVRNARTSSGLIQVTTNEAGVRALNVDTYFPV